MNIKNLYNKLFDNNIVELNNDKIINQDKNLDPQLVNDTASLKTQILLLTQEEIFQHAL